MNDCDGSMVLFLCGVCVVVTALIVGPIGYALGRRRRM